MDRTKKEGLPALVERSRRGRETFCIPPYEPTKPGFFDFFSASDAQGSALPPVDRIEQSVTFGEGGGMVEESATAATALSSFVRMPLVQHGSRKAMYIGEALIALP